MTIEQRAAKAWGITEDPEDAIWILKDGSMINGCAYGTGTRDVDHAEIGQFYKPSKFQDPGSNWIYIKKFIRRGNIRISFSSHVAFFELSSVPTPEQWRTMGRCFAKARRTDLPVQIERMGRVPGTGRTYTREEYIQYLARYAPQAMNPAPQYDKLAQHMKRRDLYQ